MSADVVPDPAQRRHQLGPGVRVEPRRVERRRGPRRRAPRASAAGRRAAGAARELAEQLLVDVGPPRHPAYVISAATRAPDDSAASSSASRSASADAATAASWRASSRSARRCSVASSTDEQRRVGRSARSEPVPVLRLLAVQQLLVHRGRPPQQVVAQPQVVAALDAHARPPAAAGTTAPCRPTPSAACHPRAPATYAGSPASSRVRSPSPSTHHHALARQSRERDPGHGDTLTPGGDSRGLRRRRDHRGGRRSRVTQAGSWATAHWHAVGSARDAAGPRGR